MRDRKPINVARVCALALCCLIFVGATARAQSKHEPRSRAGSSVAPSVALSVASPVTPSVTAAVSVRLVTDEAEAVLAVLEKKRAGQAVAEDDWRRVFASEGYTRLQKREHTMRRSFEDEDFRKFVLSDDTVARAPALAATLARWRTADPTRAARLALRYLPPGAHINAKVYPVIKPRDNSFVFEVDTDPAIFMYLDPTMSAAKYENYLAHEMHHIGYGTACPAASVKEEIARLPRGTYTAVRYLGAFGEGFAMLAAAGGPDRHPHATSDAPTRARWDRDVANFDADLRRVERFLQDVIAGRLSEQQIEEQSSAFFGVQGAWYTVGWKMCFVIEKTFGRRALIDAMCDQRNLLGVYNRAAAIYARRRHERLATWSPAFVDAVAPRAR